MPGNLTIRLTNVGQIFMSRNRKVASTWRWGKTGVAILVMSAAVIIMASAFWAWSDLQQLTLNYQISQAQETQKQLWDLNRKLHIELSNLSSISRLEKLAVEQFGMGAPLPSQVINVQ